MKILPVHSPTVSVPRSFILEHMHDAPPAYSLVYIYCLSLTKPEELSSVAARFKLTERETTEALKFWRERGLLGDDPDEEPEAEPIPAPVEISIEVPDELPARETALSMETKPVYSTEEIGMFMERSEDIRRLFKSVERILARPINYNDMNLALTFFEWYMLPVDVIEILLDYCMSNGKTGGRYMEAVARDWADSGVNTPEAAILHVQKLSGYSTVLKALGLANSSLTKKQIAYIQKWTSEFGHSIELICEACETASLKDVKSRWSYADSILKSWFELGLKTIADVVKQDERFRQKEQQEQKPAEKSKKQAGKFDNFEQREWDFDKIEEMSNRLLDSRVSK